VTQTEKLLTKLKDGRISGAELVTLMGKLGWRLMRQKGSHQTWSNGGKILIVIAERIDLKPYQIKEAQRALFGG
jgi:predicted RNA binding protein YcfA (HicA-like mRNA interferase family)